ncbi:Hydroxymethylglutaryl-CoA synthase [Auxenochlorella protothecoides]|uniref:Hydroxymethylglutaryl-CoA synthase n=1 Tax=Auxenochlorella protothecoides TaxID=3075 RepID=A0A087SMW8_AUXPR|nr:Hydroxymethylglutaryl-CoA synthase [Auxenochlorella protothecoides]KFM27072.1 Hydroxymethylglutaryl-CoA synthase [Auxenochlorella protothecoides]
MSIDESGPAPPQAENVGILAAEVYFPTTYVRQEDLEKHDGVPSGKYTIGLGQQGLSFCGDREDPVSMGLTVFHQLLRRHGVSPSEVGHLQVGTESGVDGSKSLKTYLMPILEAAGNTDVEGVDCVQACYGGTAALLAAAAWVESRAWDGRLAVVASHMAHAYDFYKPTTGYPAVDGPLSVYCYLHTLDVCWARYAERFERALHAPCTLDAVDHVLFHAPYNKLVQKAYARLWYLDGCRNGGADPSPAHSHTPIAHPYPPTAMPPGLEKYLLGATHASYDAKVRPGTCVQRQCGNMYTASVWSGVAQLLETTGAALEGRRVLLYSYGSGISATLLSLRGRAVAPGSRFSLARLQAGSDLAVRLARRPAAPPADFLAAVARAEALRGAKAYATLWPRVEDLAPGTYYLKEVDERHRRVYGRRDE